MKKDKYIYLIEIPEIQDYVDEEKIKNETKLTNQEKIILKNLVKNAIDRKQKQINSTKYDFDCDNRTLLRKKYFKQKSILQNLKEKLKMKTLKDKEIEINSMIDNKVFYSKDVKKAVLEFEKKILFKAFIKTNEEYYPKYVLDIHKEIFGNFEK